MERPWAMQPPIQHLHTPVLVRAVESPRLGNADAPLPLPQPPTPIAFATPIGGDPSLPRAATAACELHTPRAWALGSRAATSAATVDPALVVARSAYFSLHIGLPKYGL